MTEVVFSLGQSFELAVRNAIRKELDSIHHGLMDKDQILVYLGITKDDLYTFINDGLLREGVHWFYLEKDGKKSTKKKYIPKKCLKAIVEHHAISD